MQRPLIITVALALFLTTQGLVPAYADNAEQQVVNLVNAERTQHGLAPLAVSPALTGAARAYAQAMANGGFFGHVGADGSTFISRDLGAGYTGATYLAENLAAGQTTPQQVIDAWLASPAHRSNLLSSNVSEMGIGHAFQAGSRFGNYWVAEFGERPDQTRAAVKVSSRGGNRPAPTPRIAARPIARAVQTVSQTPPLKPPASLGGTGDFDVLGRPLTGVMSDPVVPGETVQYFQRAVLEWHPKNPPGYRIERRLLGDILYPGADPPVPPSNAPPGPVEYFPYSPGKTTGLGHFVADYTRTGQPIYFKQYFDGHGGVAVFGYPKDEPRVRDGLWTQRFQAAILQYHPEYDRDGIIPGTNLPWRYFRVQTRLLGEQYAQAHDLPFR